MYSNYYNENANDVKNYVSETLNLFWRHSVMGKYQIFPEKNIYIV